MRRTRLARQVARVALAALALVTCLSVRVRAQEALPPPLHISADNMTGTHGPEGDVVLLKGNVEIIRGKTVITSETGTYQRAVGMLYLEGRVKIVDSTTTITCDRASYSENEDIVQLNGNVVAYDRDATLRGPSATYDRAAGRADMYGGVRGRQKDQTITSDRAAYFRDSLVIQARGNVRGEDEKNHMVLTAREVDYDRGTDEAEARGEPALSAKDEDGRESVIRSRLLRLNTDTRVAQAIDSVRVVRDTLQARGDYGLFDDEAGRGWLFGSPRVWDDQTSATGDTLEMRTQGRQLQSVVVLGHAVMDYRGNRPGTVGETSRLTGQRADVFFTREDIDSLVSTGSARNEYRAVAQRGKTPEQNVALGDTITVFFTDRKIDHARVQGKANGEYRLAVAVGDTTAEREEVVRYDATKIDYVVPKSQIVLDHAAHLTYKDLELRSRRVTFDSEKQTLVAEGSPELVDRGDKVDGHLMTYDLETRVGNIYKAETAYEKGLYHGDRIRKVSENELQVEGAEFSTCSLAEPHYHFAAHWMKIYLKDKLVAKPVVFYVRHVPLLALPFWVFPIKPGRHSGFMLPQFELGFSNQAGRFLRNAGYYWAPNDYFDLTLSGDYYAAEPSWVMRAEGNYKKLYLLDGDFRGSIARNEAAGTEDYDFYASHSQDLSPRTRLSSQASFVSSRTYNSSNLYGRPLSLRLNRFLTSNFAITHSADWASFSAVIDRRQDLDADQSLAEVNGVGPIRFTQAALPNLTESFPSLSVGFPTRTVGSLPLLRGTGLGKALGNLYFGLNSRFVSYRERRAYADYTYFQTDTTLDSALTLGQALTTRRGFQSDVSLYDSRRLMGWLNLSPSLSGTVAVFDFDQLGHKVVPTGTWSASASTNASFYGTFHTHVGPLTGIRHIVTPRVSFAYSPEFKNLVYTDANGVKQPRFSSFSGISVSGFRRMEMDFGLDQRLQAKLGEGEKARKLDNLLSMSLSGSYNFLYRESGLQHPLSNIGASLFLQPPGVVNGSANWVINPYSHRPLQSLTYNVGVDLSNKPQKRTATPALPTEERETVEAVDEEFGGFEEAWSVGLAYSYAGGYGSTGTIGGLRWASNQTANSVIRYKFTPAWSFDYSTSFDVTNHQFGIQYFSLNRDLHCWTVAFTRTFAPGGEAEYYFRLSVKDQKEIYVERGSRTGSLGGIQ